MVSSQRLHSTPESLATFLAYSAWVDSMNTKPANTWRVHGRLFNSGIIAIDRPKTFRKLSGITFFSDPNRQILIVSGAFQKTSLSKSGLSISVSLYSSKGQNLVCCDTGKTSKNGAEIFRRFDLPAINGGRLPAGVYFVKVSVGGISLFQRVLLFCFLIFILFFLLLLFLLLLISFKFLH